jgi:glycolate oxidase FAD binding subunit
MRHRYGAARDLLLGMTVVLSDGTVARSGGKVIKNVAGYDLAKLFSGSYGTLGLIGRVSVRLHPRPPSTSTARGIAADPDVLTRAASAVTHAPLEAMAVDVAWEDGAGRVLARFGGATSHRQAERAASLMTEAGANTELVDDDDTVWNEQRSRQRSGDGVVVRVSGLQTDIARVLRVAERIGGSVVGRAGGLMWMTVREADPAEAVGRVEELRRDLAPLACVVLDAPDEVRTKLDVWGAGDDGAVDLMRRVKSRFDPHGICNPGIFVGGI